MPDEHADVASPYVTLSREEWAALSQTLPGHLTEDMVKAARSLQDPIDLDQVRQVYAPLTELINLYMRGTGQIYSTTHRFLKLHGHPRTPFVIGVAGSVSVGKSTTSRLLKELLAELPGDPRVDLITTDGFLYPNAELEARGLMDRKGFPESYNRHALLDFMRQVKSGASEVSAPVYSHLTYDIVPDERHVVRQPDVLIVEGLNVLQPPRQASAIGSDPVTVADYFDFSIYVDADEADLRTWYIDRFMLLRDTAFHDPHSFFRRFTDIPDDEARAMAGQVWDDINGPNLTRNIEPTRGRARVILHKGPDHAVEWVRIRKI